MSSGIFSKAIIPSLEIGSYEALWMENGTSFNRIAKKFKSGNGAFLSDLLVSNNLELAKDYYQQILNRVKKAHLKNFGVIFRETLDYPAQLNDAKAPLQVIYYAGSWNLVYSKSVTIVGTRHPTTESLHRTDKLVKEFVKTGFTIISGLATGIETRAHTSTINAGGKTIAVIGTPLDITYPKENTGLFNTIVENHLAISQVPFIRYSSQTFQRNRFYFHERNKTMSALSEAMIIVEAGETSGTLIQARAAIEQGRKLFILASCFEKGLTWPDKYLARGAIKVSDFDDIWHNLVKPSRAQTEYLNLDKLG